MSLMESPLLKTRRALEAGIEQGLHFGGEVVVSTASGANLRLTVGERGPESPMEPNLLMAWFCVAKPVLVLALLQLTRSGDVGLHDRVSDVIPEFKGSGKERIEFWHVLTHTAGFMEDPALAHVEREWETVIGAICQADLEDGWIPGSHAAYQFASFWYIIGEALIRLTDTSLSELLKKLVLEPCGLLDTYIGMSRKEYFDVRDRITVVYYPTSEGERVPVPLQRGGSLDDIEVCCASGPLSPRGTLSDMARFYASLLACDVWGELIGPDLLTMMTTPQRIGMFDSSLGVTMDFGLGTQTQSRQYGKLAARFGKWSSNRTFGHWGGKQIAVCADPEEGIVAAIGLTCFATDLISEKRRGNQLFTAIYEDLQASECVAGNPA